MIEAMILAYFLRLPVHPSDAAETADARLVRMSMGAEAVGVVAAGDTELAWSLAVLAYREGHLRRDIQHGACPEHECDRGRARSWWGLHHPPALPQEEWLGWAADGPLPLVRAASRAAGYLRFGRMRCGDLEGALALYATGYSCDWSGASARATEIRSAARGLR